MGSASCEAPAAWDCTFDYTDVERIDLPEIDCALLSTLLEESQAEEEKLVLGVQSEATASSDVRLQGDLEDCGLEDMLLETQDSSSASTCMMHVEDSFWADLAMSVPSSPSDVDMGEWLLSSGEVGMVDYEDSEVYQLYSSYYCGDVPVEDGSYSPLW